MLHSNGNHTGSKEEHAKVADILLVVGLGCIWVVRAEDFQFDIEGLLVHCQGLIWLTLFVEHVSDAARTQSIGRKYSQNAKEMATYFM